MIDKVKKQYKNTELLLDLFIEKYHNVNIYVRIDYYKKEKCYKLSWIDLSHIKGNNIASVISYEYIPDGMIEHIKNLLINIKINNKEDINDEYKVTLCSYLKENKFNISFNRYIPKELSQIFSLFVIIFDNLPRKLNGFLQEIEAIIMGNKNRFEYEDPLEFDLFNDEINKIFDYQICERGEEYFKENRVFFLEKIADKYFAVVGGKGLYVVIIEYDEEKKITRVHCSCPCDFRCKHIYAVIKAIRENKFHKFYKISHMNSDMELLDRIMNFNFLLTIGIDDQNNNYLIIEDGLLKLLPVVNNKGKSEWIILEDDENNSLSKRLESIILKK